MTPMTTTLALAPMELLTGRGGWCVVDPATVLTRLWYFDGKFLRAEGFRRDQEYVRSLVAVSNQAVGHGLVHGFTASKGQGDVVRVQPGLALAPSGRPVLLTSTQNLPIPELIARATNRGDGQTSGEYHPTGDSADFAPCPADTADPPDVVGGAGTMWVLYARSTEALCGEEERFGQLCEDACATETDRSLVVEGVCFFVERLDLPLPKSRVVPFDGRHLRSRYASAYYAWERSATSSLISGAGLRSPIWCQGAEGVSGDAVALGVFDRVGGTTTFVDCWTARRELMETNPARYWAWRMARRPRDVFLAQVLQFQCQLLDVAVDPGVPPSTGCEDERRALWAAHEMLKTFDDAKGIGSDAFTKFAALREQVASVLAKNETAISSSLLVDRGIVQLPPCGYLPVDPQVTIETQVRAYMGPGVDLRFCTARPDFIGEAFEEAQHLERISLTQGIDDPGKLEEVDVIVPDGRFEPLPAEASPVFQGNLYFMPQTEIRGEATTPGAALGLAAVAREHAGERWSWAMAGAGEAVGVAGIVPLMAAVLIQAGVDRTKMAAADVAVDEPVDVPFNDEEKLNAHLAGRAFIPHLAEAAREARVRRTRIQELADEGERNIAAAAGPEPAVDPGEKRKVAVWFDVEIDRPLTDLGLNESVPASLRVSMASPAKTNGMLIDVRMSDALLTVEDTSTTTNAAGDVITSIITRLAGQLDPLIVFGENVVDQPPSGFTDVLLNWILGQTATGAHVFNVVMSPSESAPFLPMLAARDEGDPRHIEGEVTVTMPESAMIRMATHVAAATKLARFELDELIGGFPASPAAQQVGEAAIEMIGAPLALPERDPSFVTTARHRLLDDAQANPTNHLVGGADWVFFHRRRDRRCGDVAPGPVGVRRYQLLHAVVDPAPLTRTKAAAKALAADPSAVAPTFEPVATVEFEVGSAKLVTLPEVLRTAWKAKDRGTELLQVAAGDIGIGDGENVVMGRVATVRGVLGTAIDQHQTAVQFLPAVPPEFREPGLDGVILTVGRKPEKPTVDGCLTLVRLDHNGMSILADMRDELATMTAEDVLDRLSGGSVPVDTFPATFEEGPVAINEQDVIKWWGPLPAEGAGYVLAPAAVGGQEDLWRDRVVATVIAVQGSTPGPEGSIADAGDCGGMVFLFSGIFAPGIPVPQ